MTRMGRFLLGVKNCTQCEQSNAILERMTRMSRFPLVDQNLAQCDQSNPILKRMKASYWTRIFMTIHKEKWTKRYYMLMQIKLVYELLF